GTYASKGGTNNSGTLVSDGGNTGNSASKGGQIQTGANDVGGDYISKSNYDNGAKTWNTYKVSSDLSLSSTVSGNSVTAGAVPLSGGGSISTGGVSLSESGFAGVQTASNNTGLMSVNQAATSIAANANITFGSVH
ncbi:MAG: hypothetical protein ACXWK7_10625, partial [Caulobacteraceae bacterium]